MSCSIACYKSHQKNHDAAAGPGQMTNFPSSSLNEQSLNSSDSFDVDHESVAKSPADFSKLDSCEELDLLFMKYPSLRLELQAIYKRVTEPFDGQQQWSPKLNHGKGPSRSVWNQEIAFKNALRALQKSQNSAVGSEALREFRKLVLMHESDPPESGKIKANF